MYYQIRGYEIRLYPGYFSGIHIIASYIVRPEAPLIIAALTNLWRWTIFGIKTSEEFLCKLFTNIIFYAFNVNLTHYQNREDEIVLYRRFKKYFFK